MRTPASLNGHPIHAMLVPLAIGLWIFALVADLAVLLGGAAAWGVVAFYCIAGGIAGALLAAVPGLIDLLSLKDPATRSVGIKHMVLNLAAVAVFALNLYLRWNSTGGAGPWWLTLAGVAAIGVSGWLGGELVYRHGVGQDPLPR